MNLGENYISVKPEEHCTTDELGKRFHFCESLGNKSTSEEAWRDNSSTTEEIGKKVALLKLGIILPLPRKIGKKGSTTEELGIILPLLKQIGIILPILKNPG